MRSLNQLMSGIFTWKYTFKNADSFSVKHLSITSARSTSDHLILYILFQQNIYLTNVQASHCLPASLSASPSSSNLRLGERERCHADSGIQWCQGLAAALDTGLVRPPCQAKRSSGIPARFIIFLLMTPQAAARAADWDDDGWERRAAEQSPFGALLLFSCLQEPWIHKQHLLMFIQSRTP